MNYGGLETLPQAEDEEDKKENFAEQDELFSTVERKWKVHQEELRKIPGAYPDFHFHTLLPKLEEWKKSHPDFLDYRLYHVLIGSTMPADYPNPKMDFSGHEMQHFMESL